MVHSIITIAWIVFTAYCSSRCATAISPEELTLPIQTTQSEYREPSIRTTIDPAEVPTRGEGGRDLLATLEDVSSLEDTERPRIQGAEEVVATDAGMGVPSSGHKQDSPRAVETTEENSFTSNGVQITNNSSTKGEKNVMATHRVHELKPEEAITAGGTTLTHARQDQNDSHLSRELDISNDTEPLPTYEYEVDEVDWCKATPCGDIHVLCRYPDPGISANCVDYTPFPMSGTAKKYITSTFNFRRNLVAGGFEYKLPPAAYMMRLKWDDTLEMFAQRWIDQCIYDPYLFITNYEKAPRHSSCRDHPDFRVAQLAIRSDSITDGDVIDLVNLMISYMSSSNKKFTNHVLRSGYVPIEDQGAILLHSNAHKIGCAAAAFQVSVRKGILKHRLGQMYCNIGPINDLFLLDRYYETGAPCSKCPRNTRCRKKWASFKNLCEFEEDLRDESISMHDEHVFSSGYNQEYSKAVLELILFLVLVHYK